MALSGEAVTLAVNNLQNELRTFSGDDTLLVSNVIPEDKSLGSFITTECNLSSEPFLVYIFSETGDIRNIFL